jgi:hypothetical protein
MQSLSRRQMLGTLAAAGLSFPFITRAASPKAKITNTRVISLRPTITTKGGLILFCVNPVINA